MNWGYLIVPKKASGPPVLVKCEICGKEEYQPQYRAKRYKTCSVECRAKRSSILYSKKQEKKCEICGEIFYVKQHEYDRRKCCSKKCDAERKKKMYKGENNPNYGNRGELCVAWKGGRNITGYGYVELRMPDHPMSNKYGYLFEHRYVMSEHLGRLLEPWEHIHHIDGNKMNNDISNLQIVTLSEHMRMHNSTKELVKDETNGKIIGVISHKFNALYLDEEGNINIE